MPKMIARDVQRCSLIQMAIQPFLVSLKMASIWVLVGATRHAVELFTIDRPCAGYTSQTSGLPTPRAAVANLKAEFNNQHSQPD